MTATDIQTGNPKIDGRYVAFFRCQAAACRDWIEPVLMIWSKGKWVTTFGAPSHVVGWIGPIPAIKLAEINTADDQAEIYDL